MISLHPSIFIISFDSLKYKIVSIEVRGLPLLISKTKPPGIRVPGVWFLILKYR